MENEGGGADREIAPPQGRHKMDSPSERPADADVVSSDTKN